MTICRVASQISLLRIVNRNVFTKNMFYEFQAGVWSVRSEDFSRASLVLIYRRTDGLYIWFTFQQKETKSKSSFFIRCSDRTCTGLLGRRVGW